MSLAPLLCVIPVHNGAAFVGRAITSLLDQQSPPSRIAVVDDASTDDLAAVLKTFDERVVCLYQERAGPAAARNLGAASGEEPVIAFLDADDRYLPQRFSRVLEALQASASLGGGVCMAQNVDDLDRPIGEPLPAYTAGALVVRRGVFENVGPFDADLPHGSSLDWFLRARRAGVEIMLDPQPLLRRHVNTGSFSSSQADVSLKEHLLVVRASLRLRRAQGGAPST